MARTAPARWEHFVRSAAHSPGTVRPAASSQKRGLRRWTGRASPARTKPQETSLSPVRDLRLLPAAVAAWGTAALAIRLDPQEAVLLGVLLALCTLGCAVAVRRQSLPAAQVFLVALGVAAMVCFPAAAHLEQRASAPLSAAIAAGAHVTVKLRAVGDPRETASVGPDGTPRWLVEAEFLEGTFDGSRFTAGTPVVVLGSAEWGSIAHGDVLRSAGKPLATEPGDRAGALLVATTAPVLIEMQAGAGSPVERLRERFLALASSTAVPDDGLMPGMVIGARSSVSQDLVDTMKATGLTHLTAVSGANCSYVLAFVFVLCRGCRLPRWAAAVAGIAALVGFVLLVRPEPSVLRAAVMGAIGVLAVLTGRGRLSMALLFLSIATLLAADPWLSIDYAFILSVAATSGLVLLGPLLAERLAALMPTWLAQLVAVPLAAQLFCSPVLALIQPSLPTYSLPANIAASPLVPFITITGMVSVMLVAVVPWAALPFAAAAGWAAVGVAQIAGFFASAPLAAIPWPAGIGGAVLLALTSAVVVVAVARGPEVVAVARSALRAVRRAGKRRPEGAGRMGLGSPLLHPAGLVAVGCALGFAALWVWNGVLGHRTADWAVAACDVGQGDGLAVRTGPRSAMVFDAGPEASLMDACLDRLGVDTVDVLVITHLHEDHYGGIAGVFDGRSVRRLLYSTAEEALPRTVSNAAAAAGITGEKVSTGATGSVGNIGWSVLWPPSNAVVGSENNASAVVLVTVTGDGGSPGAELLFTGDLEEDAAGRLLAAHPHLEVAGVDVLKVAHHGARNGGSTMIEALSPQLALISAGKDNDYGHPHPETLDALEAEGVHVARTDLAGTVLLTFEGEAVRIRTTR